MEFAVVAVYTGAVVAVYTDTLSFTVHQGVVQPADSNQSFTRCLEFFRPITIS